MPVNWLDAHVEQALRLRLCTKIGCTTCGAMKFRRGTLAALTTATGLPASSFGDQPVKLAVAEALAGLVEDHPEHPDRTSAIRLLLSEVWDGAPLAGGEVFRLLEGSWAGRLLAAMREHDDKLRTARRERALFESSEATRERRVQAALARATRHASRIREGRQRATLMCEAVAAVRAAHPSRRVEVLLRSGLPIEGFQPDLLVDDVVPLTPTDHLLALLVRLDRRQGAWRRVKAAARQELSGRSITVP